MSFLPEDVNIRRSQIWKEDSFIFYQEIKQQRRCIVSSALLFYKFSVSKIITSDKQSIAEKFAGIFGLFAHAFIRIGSQ